MVFDKYPFMGRPGPTRIYDSLERPFKPIDIFETFQKEEIVLQIAEESHNNGVRKSSNPKGRKGKAYKGFSRYANFDKKLIEVADIRLMDAMLCTMGIVKVPEINHYWSRRRILKTDFIKACMPRDRFYEIFNSLHFSSLKSHESDGDKLYKVRSLIEKYKSIFKENYIPEQNISIDESIQLWKGGRVAFTVFIPRKKAKKGFQQFRLCEAETGYCWDFEYYAGNEKEAYLIEESHGVNLKNFTIPARIVLHLLQPLLNKGYTVGVDNLYTDPRLFKFLIQNQTNAIGTFRANKKFLPKGTLGKKWKKGKYRSWYQKIIDDRGLMIITWKDKKAVRVMSTFHDDQFVEIPDRSLTWYNPDAKKKKPKVCVDYKTIMPGVDKMDQMMSTYDPTKKRMKRYYRRIYFTLLEMCYYNAFVVYNKLMDNEKDKLKYLEFKLKIIEETVTKYSAKYCQTANGAVSLESLITRARVYSEDHPLRMVPGDHFPIPVGYNDKGDELRRHCKFCRSQSVKGYQKDPPKCKYQCNICEAPLCIFPCFLRYHKTEHYKDFNKKELKVCGIVKL